MNKTTFKRLVSLGYVPHTDGAVFQLLALPPTIPVTVSPHSSPSTAETAEAMSLRTCQNALDVLELGLAEGVSEDSLCPDMEFEDFLGETVASESEA